MDFHTSFKAAILASPERWTQPFFLPTVLLQTYIGRLDLRANTLEVALVELEKGIGVTFAGGSVPSHGDERWPRDIDASKKTRELHSTATEIIYLLTSCDFVKSYGPFLLEAAGAVGTGDAQASMLKQHIASLVTTAKLLGNRYSNSKSRVDLQIGVLFNIIGQQASMASKRDAEYSLEIAKSAREDTVSMSTFTFITALFIPATFIATMFSMDMFDWGDGQASDAAVSNRFWIFWVIAIPLTLATMLGWFYWRRRVISRLEKRLDPWSKDLEK